jgi:hypothetical protein
VDGRPATQDDIAAEWRHIKALTYLAKAGADAAQRESSLVLPPAAIQRLCEAKLQSFHDILIRWPAFAAMDSWPVEAQTALLSMAWAQGPAFGPTWPHFSAACAAQDWAAAAAQCEMSGIGVGPRNEENRRLFRAAAGLAPS